jgi:hypothetical protein
VPDVTSEKSPEFTPVTVSLNVTVHDTLAALVGDAVARFTDCTVGGPRSMAAVLKVLFALTRSFPAASRERTR